MWQEAYHDYLVLSCSELTCKCWRYNEHEILHSQRLWEALLTQSLPCAYSLPCTLYILLVFPPPLSFSRWPKCPLLLWSCLYQQVLYSNSSSYKEIHLVALQPLVEERKAYVDLAIHCRLHDHTEQRDKIRWKKERGRLKYTQEMSTTVH